jgi:hypothetical protein
MRCDQPTVSTMQRPKNHLLILFGLLALAVVPSAASAQTSCHLLTSANPVPQRFGAAYNLFSSAVLVTVDCGPASDAILQVGDGQNTLYIYNTGYEWDGSILRQLVLDGPIPNGDWYVGSAVTSLIRSEAEQAEDNFVLAYTCFWNGSQWKCGCRDEACTTNYWQLQAFRHRGGGAAAAGSCLATFSGPTTELNQKHGYATTKIATWENQARFDAWGGRWQSLINYTERNNTAPIQLGADWGTNNDKDGRRDLWSSKYKTPPQSQPFCFYGGVVVGAQPVDATWGEIKREYCPGHEGSCAGGGYAITINGGRGSVVEGMRVHNHHDGFVPYMNDGFIYRGNWQSYTRDDCIENDAGAEGTIEDNIFDGCFVFYSNAGGGVTAAGARGILRIINNLVKMEAMPGPPSKSDPIGNRNNKGYGEFFKVRQDDVDAKKVPKIVFRDNIFAFEAQGTRNPLFIGSHVPVTECSNNTILWFGSGSFPKEIPSSLESCFTVLTGSQAKQRWEQERQQWIDSHSDIPRL